MNQPLSIKMSNNIFALKMLSYVYGHIYINNRISLGIRLYFIMLPGLVVISPNSKRKQSNTCPDQLREHNL